MANLHAMQKNRKWSLMFKQVTLKRRVTLQYSFGSIWEVKWKGLQITIKENDSYGMSTAKLMQGGKTFPDLSNGATD